MSEEWWVLQTMKEYEETTGQDLRELRALINSKMQSVRGVDKYPFEAVEKVAWDEGWGYRVYLQDGTISEPYETVLCTDDSVTAFSLE